MDSAALIEHNIRAHDRVADSYAAEHGEIYNPIEQARLRATLAAALGEVRSGGLRALDFGAGAGNLTDHLVALGAQVRAADVSPEFLRQLSARGIAAAQLNGEDLREFADASFDFVGTYSVLHHVPDYLKAVREMARVLRPGGILYIDHEVAPGYWAPSDAYRAYWAEFAPPRSFGTRLLNLTRPSWYVMRMRLLLNPRYKPEGDIHVWPDDHIEWNWIEEAAACEVLQRTDYLLCRRDCPQHLYERYKDRCADVRVMVARKPG
ncbi:hypothetical protein GCM10028796_37810 [Ramlibacter monticola]|uniref:Class I SAM-dependent methyltransferase n=1 Tax=Ramlibacter monticola TaxID=1926872 RepID=A0A936Z4U2_9BURK|nr:class I SAM-dependent methyltransferase [Ramlibacter monticola]MBL0395018.1 class I SAM-dependent methyltransferase [Ramlibacter monticola]